MLLGELELDANPATAAIGKMEKALTGAVSGSLSKFGGVLSSLAMGPIGAITAAIGTAAGIIEGFKSAIDLGSDLHEMSLRTGESAGSLMILREAFSEAGLGADGLEHFLMRMQGTMTGMNEEGEDASKVFDKLGVSVEDLKKLDAIGQFEVLSKGFQSITDQATKAGLARELFGKGGGKALSLLEDPEVMETARKRAGPLADIMDKNAAVFDNLGTVISSLKLNFQEFFAGALSKIAPEGVLIADALGSIDFVGMGEAVGSLAAMVGKLGEAFIALSPYINSVSEGLSRLFGSGSTASAGLAEKYRGFAKNALADGGSMSGAIVGSMQKIGRGGGFSLGGADPILSESQKQTAVQMQIRDLLARTPPVHPSDPVPV